MPNVTEPGMMWKYAVMQSSHQHTGLHLICTKNEKDAQYFGKGHSCDAGKKFQTFCY